MSSRARRRKKKRRTGHRKLMKKRRRAARLALLRRRMMVLGGSWGVQFRQTDGRLTFYRLLEDGVSWAERDIHGLCCEFGWFVVDVDFNSKYGYKAMINVGYP